MPDTPPARPARRSFAVSALLLGALAIASAPLLVKVSEAGPIATAFWRIALALPLLWTWSLVQQGALHHQGFINNRRLLIVSGLFFACDLAVWHWSIVLTSVANATLLANLAPIFVALSAWLIFKQKLKSGFLFGLALALAGMIVLIGGDFSLSKRELTGDMLGTLTAVFYAGYQLSVVRLRKHMATSTLMAWSGLVMAAVLLPLALISGDQILPHTGTGWFKLIALAMIAQVAGQSLIAYAMAHLPATFSSVALLFQPVMAALFAWVLLGETMSALQIVGALTVLIGVYIVHHAELGRSSQRLV